MYVFYTHHQQIIQLLLETHVCECVYIHIHTYIHTYMFIHTYMYVYTYVCMYVCIPIYIYLYTYIIVYTYIYSYFFSHGMSIPKTDVDDLGLEVSFCWPISTHSGPTDGERLTYPSTDGERLMSTCDMGVLQLHGLDFKHTPSQGSPSLHPPCQRPTSRLKRWMVFRKK